MSRRARVVLVVVVGSLLLLPAGAGAGAPVDYRVVFGDIHNHTRYSDGSSGSPADAFAAATAAGADYLATSDHNFMLTTDEWAATLQQAAAATDDGEFAPLAASEWWIASGYGEMIVLGVDDIRLKANLRTPRASLSRHAVIPAFLDWLAGTGGLGVWPHPGVYGDLDEFDHWTPERDAAVIGVEIHNYGSYLGAPANWGVHDYEDQYQLALSKGWHLMPFANSDTHAANWISGSPVRTVALVEELSPRGVLEAFRARRGYATLDENLEIGFDVDGAIMGSTAGVGGGTAHVTVHDPDGAVDAISQLELIDATGVPIQSYVPPVPAADMSWDVPVGNASGFVYLRVTTISGLGAGREVTAWTAPIWFQS